MLDATLGVRSKRLEEFKVLEAIKKHIKKYKEHPQTNNMEVLAVLCCKYAYFLRNKTFHGEMLDNTFAFVPNSLDDDQIDFLTTLLKTITTELINVYDQLWVSHHVDIVPKQVK